MNKPSGEYPALRKRAARVLEALEKRYPEARSLLAFRNAWELLVATVLAAQCTDARVNQVTPEFFRRWPSARALAGAEREEVEDVIRSTGFYHNKAKNLLAAAEKIERQHQGNVPCSMEELVLLPGVARKTANIVLWGAFGLNEGLAVDTHVKRVAGRLGLTEHTDPARIERDLTRLFPRESWGDVNHRLVWFGREVCGARKPRCESCELRDPCPRKGVSDGESPRQ